MRPKGKRLLTASLIIVLGALTILLAVSLPVLLRKPSESNGLLAEYNAAMKPAGYQAEENAAFLYARAIEAYVPRPESIAAESSPWKLSEQELDTFGNWLITNAETVELCRRACDKPYCWFERPVEGHRLREMDFPELTGLRDLAWLMAWQAEFSAFSSDVESAFDQLLRLRRMGWQLANGTWIEQLVGLAVSSRSYKSAFGIVANVKIASADLARFQQDLSRALADCPQRLSYSAGELLYNQESIDDVFTDDGKGNGKIVHSRLKAQMGETISYPKAFAVALWHPDKRDTEERLQRIAAHVNATMKVTPWQLDEQGTDFQEEIVKCAGRNYYLRRLGSVRFLYEIQHQQTAYADALAATLGILRYRADRGEYPANLRQLVGAGYLIALPRDPYSDGPLVYRKTEDDFTLYSVGTDFEDNDGEHVGWSWKRLGDYVFWPVQE